MTRNIADLIAEEAEHAELAEAAADPATPLPDNVKVTRGHDRSRTLQIRLNCDEYDELERLAKSRGLPVSTVARALLLDSIAPSDTLRSTVARLEQDLIALRRQVD